MTKLSPPDKVIIMGRNKNSIWFPEVVSRITLFTFLSAVMIFLFFVSGNFQGFLDGTQIFLLKCFRYVALVFMVSGIYTLAIDIAVAVRKKRIYSFRILITVIGEIVIISVFLGTSILLTVIKGFE